MKFTDEQILSRPLSLLINKVTLENRVKVLEECCFSEVEFNVLTRFIFVLNRTVKALKKSRYIDPGVVVHQRLSDLLDIGVELPSDIGDHYTLKHIRQIIIDSYLREKLGMTELEIEKLRRVYFHIIHRNLRSIVGALKILQNQLEFSNRQIINNGFLINASPENMEKLFTDVGSIGGVPICELIKKRPKLVTYSPEKIKENIRIISSFNINEESLLYAIDALNLDPKTVHKRMTELSKIEEFDVLRSHEHFLRLLLYYTKAQLRLEFLKHSKQACSPLFVLTGSSSNFERFAMEGADDTVDAIEYLSGALEMDRTLCLEVLSRHPNWRRIPLTAISQSIKFLREKKFSDDEIRENLYLLLYPVASIETTLNSLLEMRSKGPKYSRLSNTKLLHLCLYNIELDFNFSGGGVFKPNREPNVIEAEKEPSNELVSPPASKFLKALSRGNRYGEPRSILNRSLN